MSVMPANITLCPDAASKVHMLRLEEGEDSLMLRSFISGGGCSGFQYGFGFESSPLEDDRMHHAKVPVFPDAKPMLSEDQTKLWQDQLVQAKITDHQTAEGLFALMQSRASEQHEGRMLAWRFYHAHFASNNAPSVTVLIDPISYQYLKGAEIDYKVDAKGQRFVIRNPNAKTTCGCGNSFAT